MIRKTSRIPIQLIGAIIFAGLMLSLCFPVSSQSLEQNKRVLFISSYSESFPSVPQQIKGIEAALDDDVTL